MATIVVIDDMPESRQFLVTLLGYYGHRLFEAADGLEGLAQVRATHPDLVIADLLMPTMDGFEFVRQLRAEPAVASTNVIFYTAAYSEAEMRPLAQNCGVFNFLPKPSTPEVVLQTVDLALRYVVPPPAAPPQDEFNRAHMQLMTDKLSHKVNELEATRLRLETLIKLSRELASEYHAERLLDHVCRAARRLISAKYALVVIVDTAGEVLDQCATSGMDAETAACLSPALAQPGLWRTWRSAPHPSRQRDLPGDPQAIGLPPEHPPVHTFLGVPLITAAQTYGWLCLTDRLGAEEFSVDDERLAVSLAALAAVAYENARRYGESQDYTAALQRSNTELEQFAYVASHDLQEPLRKVLGFTGLLAKRYSDQLDANAHEFLGFIVDGATRMQELIQALLTYSRLGRQGRDFAPVNCEEVLTSALRNLQGAIEESGAVITHDPLPTVLADGGQLVQLLQNLLSNAIKFRGAQPPRVHLSATRATAPSAALATTPATEWLFAVRDEGIGIDPQYTDRIFRVFQRLHSRAEYPGTGIGLAICQKVIDHHGGRIWVESQPGHGATFSFTIPEKAS